jgi:hypothetical protein
VKITAQLTLAGDERLATLYPEPSAQMLTQLRRTFPDVADERLLLRWSVASRTLIQMLSHVDHAPGDPRRYGAELVNFVAGGLAALRTES